MVLNNININFQNNTFFLTQSFKDWILLQHSLQLSKLSLWKLTQCNIYVKLLLTTHGVNASSCPTKMYCICVNYFVVSKCSVARVAPGHVILSERGDGENYLMLSCEADSCDPARAIHRSFIRTRDIGLRWALTGQQQTRVYIRDNSWALSSVARYFLLLQRLRAESAVIRGQGDVGDWPGPGAEAGLRYGRGGLSRLPLLHQNPAFVGEKQKPKPGAVKVPEYYEPVPVGELQHGAGLHRAHLPHLLLGKQALLALPRHEVGQQNFYDAMHLSHWRHFMQLKYVKFAT